MRKRTFATKWVLPYALMALILFAWWWYRGESVGGLSFVSALGFVILYFVIRKQSREMPDEVRDGGTFLQLSFGGAVETVPLSNIVEVEVEKSIRTTRVILHLREPVGALRVVAFYPLQQRSASGENLVAVNLQARVGHAA